MGGTLRTRLVVLTIALLSTVLLASLAKATYVPRRVQYMGRTTATTDGNMGSPGAANTKCQVNFPNSHICTQSEMFASGATSYGATAWVLCENVTDTQCMGVTGNFSGGFSGVGYVTCGGWTSNNGSFYGGTVSSTGVFGAGICSTALPIHCCL